MQKLDHPAVERDRTFALVLGLFERGDDLPCGFDLFHRWREDLIAGVDLRGMDQRLAVEPERAGLSADAVETVRVVDVVVDAVDDGEAVSARSRDRHSECRRKV